MLEQSGVAPAGVRSSAVLVEGGLEEGIEGLAVWRQGQPFEALVVGAAGRWILRLDFFICTIYLLTVNEGVLALSRLQTQRSRRSA